MQSAIVKFEKFKELIFKHFGQSKSYNKTYHRYLRMYEMFNKNVPEFKGFGVEIQFNLCTTTLMIALEGFTRTKSPARMDLNLFRWEKKDNKEFENALDLGYTEPKVIEINTLKMLNPIKNEHKK